MDAPTIAETYTAHFDYFDATVEINTHGEARLIIKPEEDAVPIYMTASELDGITELWERATRVD